MGEPPSMHFAEEMEMLCVEDGLAHILKAAIESLSRVAEVKYRHAQNVGFLVVSSTLPCLHAHLFVLRLGTDIKQGPPLLQSKVPCDDLL